MDHGSEAAESERLTGDAGASLVEYALLLALIAVVCIAAVSFFGASVGDSMSRSSSRIVEAG